ncbi:hypothetical protein Tco_0525632 [Tanacetum coccineum]
MIMGPSAPSSSPKGGNKISRSGEKLCFPAASMVEVFSSAPGWKLPLIPGGTLYVYSTLITPLPENESFSLNHFDDPSLPHPPPEPPDVEICFNFEPDAGVVTKKVVGDISEHDVLMPNLLPTQPTLCPVFDLLLPFSFENEDKLFKPGIFSSPFLSHWAKITIDFSESPMMISGGNIPHLDVPYLHFYPP